MSAPEFNLGPLTPEEIDRIQASQTTMGIVMQPTVRPEDGTPDAASVFQARQGQGEWQGVALRKWEHYLNNVLPSGNEVAIAHHERGLLRCIPHLIGRPDLALTLEIEEAAYAKGLLLEVEPLTGQSGLVVDGPTHKVFIGNNYRIDERGFIVPKNDDPHVHEAEIKEYPITSLDFGTDVGEQDC